jgi:nucleoside diphosphate kinase
MTGRFILVVTPDIVEREAQSVGKQAEAQVLVKIAGGNFLFLENKGISHVYRKEKSKKYYSFLINYFDKCYCS